MVEEKLALGFGGYVDYEVQWDQALFESLVRQFDIYQKEIASGVKVTDLRSLCVSILNYIYSGAGGEVFVENIQTIHEFSKIFSYKIRIGGTNTRAAITMSKLGYSARLHVLGNNEYLRTLLPKESTKIWSEETDSLYPHLIIQYPEGTEINTPYIHVRTKRANRIMYVHNPQKLVMKINPVFFENLAGFKVLLISGFNSIQDRDIFSRRMGELAEHLAALPPELKIFFEDACYVRPEYARLVQKFLCKYIDVFDLNEDEFGQRVGKAINLLDPGQILSLLSKLECFVQTPIISLHTKYWALTYGENAGAYRPCLRGGIDLATTRYRYGDDINAERYHETAALPLDSDGARFTEKIQLLGGNRICCEPSLDARESKVTTIGLGDTFVGGFLPVMAEMETMS
jgi:ADP-dependent phosphofructokinase/glucokinase